MQKLVYFFLIAFVYRITKQVASISKGKKKKLLPAVFNMVKEKPAGRCGRPCTLAIPRLHSLAEISNGHAAKPYFKQGSGNIPHHLT